MQGKDFVAQEPEEVIAVDAVKALDEVFNWSVGAAEDGDFEATFVYRSFRLLFGFEIGVG